MPVASDTAHQVNQAMLWIVGISVFFLALITFLMIFFVIKYNRKHRDTVSNIEGSAALEIAWTVIPLLIVMAMFAWGYTGYRTMKAARKDAFVVTATGRMWQWLFTYPNGAQSDVLRLPVDRDIKIETVSTDVLHSFYVPAFKVKQDAVPGRKYHIYFKPDKIGKFDLFCAEYCGTLHSGMITHVLVMPQDEFDTWYAGSKQAEAPPAAALSPAPKDIAVPEQERAESATEGSDAPADARDAAIATVAATKPPVPADGAAPPPRQQEAASTAATSDDDALEIMKQRACLSCHTTDGSKLVGPTLKGLYGSTVTVVVDGEERQAKVDDAFLRRSILDPNAEVTKGYQPIMPSQKGLISDKELAAIIKYLKGLK